MPSLSQKFVVRNFAREHADRRRERGGLGDDLVSGHGNEIAHRTGDGAHGDDDWFARPFLARTTSRQIVSEATYDPPPLSIRNRIAFTLLSPAAARKAAATVSAPIETFWKIGL